MSVDLGGGTDSASSAIRTCRNCGSHVTPRFHRVFGPNEGDVLACYSCTTLEDIRNGAASDPNYEERKNEWRGPDVA